MTPPGPHLHPTLEHAPGDFSPPGADFHPNRRSRARPLIGPKIGFFVPASQGRDRNQTALSLSAVPQLTVVPKWHFMVPACAHFWRLLRQGPRRPPRASQSHFRSHFFAVRWPLPHRPSGLTPRSLNSGSQQDSQQRPRAAVQGRQGPPVGPGQPGEPGSGRNHQETGLGGHGLGGGSGCGDFLAG